MKKRPRLFTEFKNIRTLPSGYQVAVTRGKIEFSKHFAGHSRKSFQAAMRYRDRLRRELPDKRKNIIPRSLLSKEMPLHAGSNLLGSISCEPVIASCDDYEV